MILLSADSGKMWKVWSIYRVPQLDQLDQLGPINIMMSSLEAGWFPPRASRERSVSCLRPSYTSPRWMHPLCRPATCFLVKPLTPHDGYDGLGRLGPMALWEAEKHDGLSTAVLGVVWKSRAQALEAVARRRFSDPFCQSCRSLDDHRGSWGSGSRHRAWGCHYTAI